jgi:hypothetical protein
MHRYLKASFAGLLGLALWMTGPAEKTPLLPTFVSKANALIGAPLSPLSFAGVARRSIMRRDVLALGVASEAAATLPPVTTASAAAPGSAVPIGTTVPELPVGCTSTTIEGVGYFNCAGTYYKPAYKSNNLVYVVSNP